MTRVWRDGGDRGDANKPSTCAHCIVQQWSDIIHLTSSIEEFISQVEKALGDPAAAV
jgi:hypothetical protein